MSERVRIVLQARTTSNRLPAKVLLPVGGLPLAVLCARRLGRSGHEVVLATSQDPSDDLLARTAIEGGLRVFRGSLDDVLGRFVGCVADLTDDDIVVRATADNPLTDSGFVDELLQAFRQTGGDYLGTSSPADGLPYGLSAEVFRVGALRAVALQVNDPINTEHVTPELRKRAREGGVIPRALFLDRDASYLRATIDTLGDYLAIGSVFAKVPDPIGTSWRTFLPELPTYVSTPTPKVEKNGETFSVMTLGTAQLGLKYGIANRSGRPNDDEAARILAMAVQAGITHIDTARAYGDAESRIRRLLPRYSDVKVITKLIPLDKLPDDASAREVCATVDASVYGSCADLGRTTLDVLMAHRSDDLFQWGGEALSRLQSHVQQGRIRALGASVYAPAEAVRCLADGRITYLQIPFNLLDSRWLGGEFQSALAQRPDVCVHARSVFLQGLLINESGVWPDWVRQRHEWVKSLDRLVSTLGRQSRADLCFAYVRSFPWVTTMVLGVETAVQLEQLLPLAGEPPLTQDEAKQVTPSFTDIPSRLLNPAQW